MSTWYLLDKGYKRGVRTIEVEKSTEKSVWANVYGDYGSVCRCSKQSEHFEFFEDTEALQERTIEYAERQKKRGYRIIDEAESLLGNLAEVLAQEGEQE